MKRRGSVTFALLFESLRFSEGRFVQRLVLLLILGALPKLGISQMSPVFGPKRYTRSTGKPQTFTDTFQNCETAAQYDLVVVNGDPDGSNRVSSATILLNGTEVVGPSDFNQNVAQVTKPVTLAASDTLDTTLASEPGSFLAVSLQCTRYCLSVDITTPASGTSLSVSSTNVSGTVSSAADEVGVVVNGIPAAVLDGHFVAPNVPLVLGENTLTATATNVCLNQAITTTAVDVSSLNPPPISLLATPTSGLAPFMVNLTATVSSVNPIINYQWAFNGDGVIDASGASLSQVSNTYSQPGLYLATVTATDSVGNQFSGFVPVLVRSFAELDNLLQMRWNALVGALSSQDAGRAISFFHSGFAQQFSNTFDKLRDRLPSISSSLTNANLLSEAGGVAEMVTIRTQQGTSYAYFIYFMQDEHGLWKIVAM